MTRRDFLLLADILRDTRPRYNGLRWPLWVSIRDRIGAALEERNPGFDRDRFNVHTMTRK
jgi:hypothetical protein